jgi:uncharacterized metal-binding protein YceD (DUF177 family)
MTPEFSRRYSMDSIGSTPRTVSIEANANERAAIAARFDLAELDELKATATLTASALGIETSGRLTAHVIQNCVVTAEPVVAQIDEPFTLRFVEPDQMASDTEELELSDADCDLIEIDKGAIDLGEAVAQTLGLALDPFPRCEAERVRGEERKWVAGDEAGPFAALKGLLKP